ncbi:MAG: hypothetical protein ACOX3K_02720 [Bacilli bacterium]|jgi:hypothetical protein
MFTKKRKINIIFSTLVVGMTLLAGNGLMNSLHKSAKVVGDFTYTVTLDDTLVIGDYTSFNAKTGLGNDVEMKAVGASAFNTGFITLASEGYVYNNAAITGIGRVTVVLASGNAALSYGVYADDFTKTVNITSGTEITLDYASNFFKIAAGVGGAKIESVLIKFECLEAKKYDIHWVGRVSESVEDKGVTFNTRQETAMAGWGILDWDTAELKAGFGLLTGNFIVEFDLDTIEAESNNHQYKFALALKRVNENHEGFFVSDRFGMSNQYWNDNNEVCGIDYRALKSNQPGYGNADGIDPNYIYGVDGDTKVAMSRVGNVKHELIGHITANVNVVGHHKIERTIVDTTSTFVWTFKSVGTETYVNVMQWAVDYTGPSKPNYATSTTITTHYLGDYAVSFVAAGVNASFSNYKATIL